MRAARDAAANHIKIPGVGLSPEEMKWIKSLKMSRVATQVDERAKDEVLAKKYQVWQKLAEECNIQYDSKSFIAELDEFYKPDRRAVASSENGEINQSSDRDEFAAQGRSPSEELIAISSQDLSLVDTASFNDSGIAMDEESPKAIHSHSRLTPLTTAINLLAEAHNEKSTTGAVCSPVRRFRTAQIQNTNPIMQGHEVRGYGGQDEWEGKKDAPYDLNSFCSSSTKSDGGESSNVGGFDDCSLDASDSNHDIHTSDVIAMPENTVPASDTDNFCIATQEPQAMFPSVCAESNLADKSVSGINKAEVITVEDGSGFDSEEESSISNSHDSNAAESPVPTLFAAPNLANTINDSVDQIFPITGASNHELSRTLIPLNAHEVHMLTPPATQEDVSENLAPNGSTSWTTPENPPLLSSQFGTNTVMTPIPHRAYNVQFDAIATPSTMNLIPEYSNEVEGFGTLPSDAQNIEFQSLPIFDSQAWRNAVGQYENQPFPQADIGYDFDGNNAVTDTTFVGTDPMESALQPLQADFSQEEVSLLPIEDATSMDIASSSSLYATASEDPLDPYCNFSDQSMLPVPTMLSSTLFPFRSLSTPEYKNDPTNIYHHAIPFQSSPSHDLFLPQNTPGTPTPIRKPTSTSHHRKTSSLTSYTTPNQSPIIRANKSPTRSPTKSPTKKHLRNGVKNVFASLTRANRTPSPPDFSPEGNQPTLLPTSLKRKTLHQSQYLPQSQPQSQYQFQSQPQYQPNQTPNLATTTAGPYIPQPQPHQQQYPQIAQAVMIPTPGTRNNNNLPQNKGSPTKKPRLSKPQPQHQRTQQQNAMKPNVVLGGNMRVGLTQIWGALTGGDLNGRV